MFESNYRVVGINWNKEEDVPVNLIDTQNYGEAESIYNSTPFQDYDAVELYTTTLTGERLMQRKEWKYRFIVGDKVFFSPSSKIAWQSGYYAGLRGSDEKYIEESRAIYSDNPEALECFEIGLSDRDLSTDEFKVYNSHYTDEYGSHDLIVYNKHRV